jgi:hypothetical protein
MGGALDAPGWAAEGVPGVGGVLAAGAVCRVVGSVTSGGTRSGSNELAAKTGQAASAVKASAQERLNCFSFLRVIINDSMNLKNLAVKICDHEQIRVGGQKRSR